jgi:hypothetical protein
MSDRIPTYAEFWPFYLREHSHPATRWLHFAGTSVGLGIGVTAAVLGQVSLVPAALVSASRRCIASTVVEPWIDKICA